MFSRVVKIVHPTGWPEALEVRELSANDILGMFGKGKPSSEETRNVLCQLSIHTQSGERVFSSPEAIGEVPARFVPGLMELVQVVLEINLPAGSVEVPT